MKQKKLEIFVEVFLLHGRAFTSASFAISQIYRLAVAFPQGGIAASANKFWLIAACGLSFSPWRKPRILKSQIAEYLINKGFKAEP